MAAPPIEAKQQQNITEAITNQSRTKLNSRRIPNFHNTFTHTIHLSPYLLILQRRAD